jgi:hypothetical protein
MKAEKRRKGAIQARSAAKRRSIIIVKILDVTQVTTNTDEDVPTKKKGKEDMIVRKVLKEKGITSGDEMTSTDAATMHLAKIVDKTGADMTTEINEDDMTTVGHAINMTLWHVNVTTKDGPNSRKRKRLQCLIPAVTYYLYE